MRCLDCLLIGKGAPDADVYEITGLNCGFLDPAIVNYLILCYGTRIILPSIVNCLSA